MAASDEEVRSRANRLYLRDIYAMMLFDAERSDNPLKNVDQKYRWINLTPQDREAYRRLASNLTVEAAAQL